MCVEYGQSGQMVWAPLCWRDPPLTQKTLLAFLTKHTKALDLPELKVPDKALSMVFSDLTSEQAFLLLDWIQFHRARSSALPIIFLESIQGGRWIKTSSGFKHPNQSILVVESGEVMYEIIRNVLENFSVVDQEFYARRISLYAEELRLIGVTLGLDDAQKLLLTQFKSLSSFGMKKDSAMSLMMFIGILKGRNNLDEHWLKTIKDGKWLRTSQGYYAPRGSVFLHSVLEFEAVSQVTSLPVVDEMFYGGKISSFMSELELLEVVLDQKKVYSLIAESFTFPAESSSLTADSGLLILKCIKYLEPPSGGFFEKVVNQPWLKTNLNTRCPLESILPDLEWACLLLIVELPIIDEAFYGHAIMPYASELKLIGVATDISSILKVVVKQIKFHLSSNSFTPVNLFLLLNYMRETSNPVAQELIGYLLHEKWLKTCHGYKAPGESILFSAKWGTVSSFVDLPLIDDSFYGLEIYGYKDELKMMGVVTDFKEGAPFVALGLKRPIEPALITTEGTISILECIKYLMPKFQDQQTLDDFIGNLKRSRWLKTNSGYKNPESCILFDIAWKSILNKKDLLMIDEKVYESNLSEYKNQLKVIGVKVDPKDVCVLLHRMLPSHAQTSLITRIYKFLTKFQFQPESVDESCSLIWIPGQSSTGGGEWVNSNLCILHDRDNLFSSHLYSLDKYYKKKLLPMFVSVYRVVEFPSLDDYIKLWNLWTLRDNHIVTTVECCSFWGYILNNWNLYTEEQLKQKLTKLPADTCTGNQIHFVSKDECFLPDDLQMKKMFTSVGTGPLFVWIPKSFTLSSASSRKLYEIYGSLGVRKISESTECNVGSIFSSVQPVKPCLRKGLLDKGLIRLVLGFLAGSQINMPVEDRHRAVKSLVDLPVYESAEHIKISYRLILSSDTILEVEAKRMVVWEKNSQLLIIDGSGYEDQEIDIEFVSCFAQEIAEGIVSHVGAKAVDNLSRILQMGLIYGFKEDAVEFLLTKENLELFMEDEEFLNALPECKNRKLGTLGPCTPMPQCKRRRQ